MRETKTEQQKRERRNETARLRYANNPQNRERYREKAIKRMPLKDRRRREAAKQKALELGMRPRLSFEERLIMRVLEEERKAIAKAEKAWRKHPESIRFNANKVAKGQWDKRKTDPKWRATKSLRCRLSQFTKGKESITTAELVGCDRAYFAKYLERHFQAGMTWENYGEWEIDHIVPCSHFNLENLEHQRTCFHYSNLQPLWKSDNVKKSNKVLKPVQMSLRVLT